MTTPRPLLLRGSVQELGDIELPVLPPSPGRLRCVLLRVDNKVVPE